jgi:hypothetical protein
VRQKASRLNPNAVFLNIPYDHRFRSLYLGYIAGLVHLGLEPRATLGLPDGTRRLDKIVLEIQGCRYSIHDLSRVETDRNPPFAPPRFNMPFELGLAVAWERFKPSQHTWFLFEATDYRVQKSLSDLNGTDPRIHGAQPSGVMRELSNALRRPGNQPTVPEMMSTYRVIARRSARIMSDAGAKSLFEARVFQDLCYEAKVQVDLRSLL